MFGGHKQGFFCSPIIQHSIPPSTEGLSLLESGDKFRSSRGTIISNKPPQDLPRTPAREEGWELRGETKGKMKLGLKDLWELKAQGGPAGGGSASGVYRSTPSRPEPHESRLAQHSARGESCFERWFLGILHTPRSLEIHRSERKESGDGKWVFTTALVSGTQ